MESDLSSLTLLICHLSRHSFKIWSLVANGPQGRGLLHLYWPVIVLIMSHQVSSPQHVPFKTLSPIYWLTGHEEKIMCKDNT